VTPLFTADSIGKRFGARVVLKAASVWAYPGRITVLFGRNGCGKSTLLRIGVGLLAADHGVVQYAGRSYLRPHLHQLAKQGLFYLPADGFLTPGLTLRQHLEAVQSCFGTDVMWAIKRLRVAELLDVKTRAFSGGERRRAEVALALGREPRCLLADEPFAGISPATAEVLADAFQDSRARGCALVITGHEVPQLMEVADEVVWARPVRLTILVVQRRQRSTSSSVVSTWGQDSGVQRGGRVRRPKHWDRARCPNLALQGMRSLASPRVPGFWRSSAPLSAMR
jgi:lipopolysaccharide export system ATP-binding protein